MYHYVRDYSSDKHQNMIGMDVKEFEDQIKDLKSYGSIISLGEFDSLAFNNGNHFLLTFDDGLIDSYDYILPILRSYNITGVFNIISKAVMEPFVPTSHKIHFLMGHLTFEVFQEKIISAYSRIIGGNIWECYDEKKAKTAYRWDDMYVKRFKWTLNFGILEEYRKKIVDSVFLDYFSEEDVSNNLFLNKDQIEEIYNEGNYIGGHTHSHTNLGTLSENEQENEIRKCDNFISSYSRGGIKAFSYPFGKENNFNFMSINILKKYGYSHAFSNIQPKSKDEKFNENVYAIKRIDPKDI